MDVLQSHSLGEIPKMRKVAERRQTQGRGQKEQRARGSGVWNQEGGA